MVNMIVTEVTMISAFVYLESSCKTKVHAIPYVVHAVNTYIYKHSFFPDVIRQWNQLPKDVITSASLHTYESLIHK